jgi:hypothetical protein
MIQAIETRYKGYRCRSRLEARWLYFLDLIGIHYEYEPQGFCGDGIYYLPDIYLPAYHTFVEVKNETVYENDELRAEARRKMEAVCGSCLEYAGIIVYGDPLAGLCESYCFLSNEMCSGTDWVPVSFEYIRNNTASGAGICYNGDVLMRTYAGTMMYEGFEDISTDTYAYVPDLRDLMFQAKLKARGARFEHGENPENTVNAESAEFMTAYRCSEAILSVG